MSKRQPLSISEIEAALAELPKWRTVNGKLHRDFKFKNFVQAFGFMTQVAILAERMDHHPEWSNVYGQVSIDLVTHSAGNAISQLDIELAHQIDEIIL
ncbi:MAG: 4a-hydroxytetrahydrobiopterin dehydratase [Caldilineaceae bacterium]